MNMMTKSFLVSCVLCLGLNPLSYAADVYLDNVVILLDASGSMSQDMRGSGVRKLDAAKGALKEVLQQIPQTTNVGLVVFGGNIKRNSAWIYPLGPRVEDKLMRAVDVPQPGGGTPLGAHIKIAADRLLAERGKQFGYGSYRLLIVTDGEAQDQNLVDKYTPEVLARGITVDVIGVDMKKSHTLATKVHSYRKADDPAGLRQAVAEVFAEVAEDSAGDTATADAFDLVAPIPFEVADGMIRALSSSGNHPIGGRPKGLKPAAAAAPVAGAVSPARPIPGQAQRRQPDSRPPNSTQERPFGGGGGKVAWVLICIVAIVIFAVRSGGKRRGRRGQ